MKKEILLKVNEEITPLLPGEENTLKGGYGIVGTDLVVTPRNNNTNCDNSGNLNTNSNCKCSNCGSAKSAYY